LLLFPDDRFKDMLKEKIEDDLKKALKEGDSLKRDVLRYLLTVIKNFQIETRAKEKKVEDEDVIKLIRRQVKQRREAISQYRQGNRQDLAQKEEKEISIVEKYLPAQFSEEDLRELVKKKIKEAEIQDRSDFGKLMGIVMREVKGQADGNLVRKIVEEELARPS